MRIFTADQVHEALPWPLLVDHLSRAFIAGAHVPARHVHPLGDHDALLLMPAWSDSVMGVKLVTVMPGNASRAIATVQATYLLMDRLTGQALALVDGEALTLRRTAAASALAAQHLARPDAHRLLVVGTGQLASWLVRAHCALRPSITQVLVWGRDAPSRTALATTLAHEGLPAMACADLETGVRTSDIITCATTATTPLVQGGWLQPGTHLDLVGGYKPDMREADDAAMQMARICVDTYTGALSEAGDLVQPLQAGRFDRSHVLAELAEVLRGEVVVRKSEREITAFKSVGTALEDLAAAQLVWQQAR